MEVKIFIDLIDKMGVVCGGSKSADGTVESTEISTKLQRVSFNDMRGFRKVDNIRKIYEFKNKLGAG